MDACVTDTNRAASDGLPILRSDRDSVTPRPPPSASLGVASTFKPANPKLVGDQGEA
jgi:hypothetical protein